MSVVCLLLIHQILAWGFIFNKTVYSFPYWPGYSLHPQSLAQCLGHTRAWEVFAEWKNLPPSLVTQQALAQNPFPPCSYLAGNWGKDLPYIVKDTGSEKVSGRTWVSDFITGDLLYRFFCIKKVSTTSRNGMSEFRLPSDCWSIFSWKKNLLI